MNLMTLQWLVVAVAVAVAVAYIVRRIVRAFYLRSCEGCGWQPGAGAVDKLRRMNPPRIDPGLNRKE